MNLTPAAISLLVLLAGCSSTPDEVVSVPNPAAGADWETPLEGEGCTISAQVFAAEFSVLGPHLPAGYHPIDLGTIAGTDASLGRGALIYSALTCNMPDLDAGAWGILVEDPELGHTEEGVSHAYALEWHLNGPLADAVRPTNITMRTVDFDWMIGGAGNINPELSSISTVALEAIDGNGTLLDTNNRAAVAIDVPISGFAFWAEGHNGTLGSHIYIDRSSDVNPTIYSLGTADCTFREGTPPHIVLGRTDCTPNANDVVIGVNIDQFALRDSNVRFHAGQYAA